MSEKYHGWANYETWNVALWIGNDESLYNIARKYNNYTDAQTEIIKFEACTPDGVSYTSRSINVAELDAMIKELE